MKKSDTEQVASQGYGFFCQGSVTTKCQTLFSTESQSQGLLVGYAAFSRVCNALHVEAGWQVYRNYSFYASDVQSCLFRAMKPR